MNKFRYTKTSSGTIRVESANPRQRRRDRRASWFSTILMSVLTFFIVSCVALYFFGMTNEANARRALEGAGYKIIEFTGLRLFACGEGDFYKTGFVAWGPTGKRVEGVVCEGFWFKGATIRTD